jgi:hypothetical protein
MLQKIGRDKNARRARSGRHYWASRNTSAARVASEYVGDDPAVAEAAERAVKERKAAEDHAFANKLAKRLPRSSMRRLKKREAEPRPARFHIRPYKMHFGNLEFGG